MNRDQQTHYAEQARSVMSQRGWSNARLSRESGVAENTIADFLTGRKRTQPGRLRQILDALDIPATSGDALVVEGVPEDVRVFATVVVQRLSALNDQRRAVALAKLYPQLLMATGSVPGLEVTEEAEDLA